MSDRVLDRQIDVLSGNAERRMKAELQAEKYQILSDRQRQRDANRARHRALVEMAAGPAAAAGVLPTVAALTPHERRNYSVARLVSSIAGPKRQPCLEVEISESISADLGQQPMHGGAWLPLRISASGLNTNTNAAGGYAVATDVHNIVDALRNHCKVMSLGATFLSGVKANAALPVEDAILAANWMPESGGTDATQSDPSFQQRILTPHDVIACTSISRQLLAQSSVATNFWLTQRIAKAHAILLDRAAIHGTGANNQPTGLLNTSGIGSVAIGQNGGAVAASHLVSLESTVAAANGDSGALAFLTNPKQRAAMRNLPEFTGGTTPLWDDDSLLDYPAAASNQVRSDLTKGTGSNLSAIIFGDWSALAVVEFFGAIEITADPVTLKKQAMVEVSSYAAYDTTVTTTGSFAAIVDAT